jgi:serine/threonine protein kinase
MAYNAPGYLRSVLKKRKISGKQLNATTKKLRQVWQKIQRKLFFAAMTAFPCYCLLRPTCMGQTVDPRSDIYLLGCMMYEMLTGVPGVRVEKDVEMAHFWTTQSENNET